MAGLLKFMRFSGTARPRGLFHPVEKLFTNFPYYGKKISTLWKNPAGFFHTMEKLSPVFPHTGKTFTHISNRPFPAGPTNFPPRTMTSPRTVTTSGAPCTANPSYGL